MKLQLLEQYWIPIIQLVGPLFKASDQLPKQYKTAQNSTKQNNINTYKNKAGVTALERSMQSIGV